MARDNSNNESQIARAPSSLELLSQTAAVVEDAAQISPYPSTARVTPADLADCRTNSLLSIPEMAVGVPCSTGGGSSSSNHHVPLFLQQKPNNFSSITNKSHHDGFLMNGLHGSAIESHGSSYSSSNHHHHQGLSYSCSNGSLSSTTAPSARHSMVTTTTTMTTTTASNTTVTATNRGSNGGTSNHPVSAGSESGESGSSNAELSAVPSFFPSASFASSHSGGTNSPFQPTNMHAAFAPPRAPTLRDFPSPDYGHHHEFYESNSAPGIHEPDSATARENYHLRQQLAQKDATIDSLQKQVDSLRQEIQQLRSLPTGKISQIPVEDMLAIMNEYGSEVSDTAMPPRKSYVQKASVVRQFRRWNPNFFDYFEHRNGQWIPKLGKEGELKRREESRKIAAAARKRSKEAGGSSKHSSDESKNSSSGLI